MESYMINYFNLPKYHAFYVDLEGKHVLAAKNDDLSNLIREMEACKEAEGRPVLVLDLEGRYIKTRTNGGEWKDLVVIEIE